MIKFNTFKLVFLLIIFSGCKAQTTEKGFYDYVAEIEKNIKAPQFPDKEFDIADYGAIGDGITLNTEAINRAISACNEAGGGKVIVPEGNFLTGAIYLKSNVNLFLSENAVLSFSTNPKDYLPLVKTRWEGIDLMNYSPLIYSLNEENIAVTGKGILDGMASELNWWPWKGREEYGWKEGMPSQADSNCRPLLFEYDRKGVPVEERQFGDGGFLRPQFINFNQCKNILLEDFTIKNAPFWVIHPLFCDNLIVRGLNIISHGTNNDGCDPESCTNVLIEDCYFDNGDDCIAIKSGRNYDGRKWNKPTENVIIRNCKMADGHGGVVIGSEISGGCRNVFVDSCEMSSPNLDRAIRIKTNSNRGGITENIYVQNITVGEVSGEILRINCLYDIKKEGSGEFIPVVRNVNLSNFTSEKSKYGIRLEGIEGQDCIYNINIKNCILQGVESGNRISNARDINFNNVRINGEIANIE